GNSVLEGARRTGGKYSRSHLPSGTWPSADASDIRGSIALTPSNGRTVDLPIQRCANFQHGTASEVPPGRRDLLGWNRTDRARYTGGRSKRQHFPKTWSNPGAS